jgi:hypothetical protein
LLCASLELSHAGKCFRVARCVSEVPAVSICPDLCACWCQWLLHDPTPDGASTFALWDRVVESLSDEDIGRSTSLAQISSAL